MPKLVRDLTGFDGKKFTIGLHPMTFGLRSMYNGWYVLATCTAHQELVVKCSPQENIGCHYFFLI